MFALNFALNSVRWRYTFECLLSVNVALAITLIHSAVSYFPLEDRLKWRINQYYHLDLHNDLGAYLAFFILSTLLGIGLFILLRVFARMQGSMDHIFVV